MNKGYAVFCDADRHFYDAPHRLVFAEGAGGSLYRAATLPVPEGWTSHRRGDWLALRPLDLSLPSQGWKIHVSACLDNAEAILATVRAYCLEHGVAFKFVPSRYLLHQRNAKYADRSASGKFITVYPADDEQCERVATDLAELLEGRPGPYILSDLRWGRGPVHLRYGSFTLRHCYDEHGELRAAVEDGSGTLVPDRRDPVFHVPDWVTPPAFLRPHLEARASVTVQDMPYDIEKALHFSNGGGVYEARDRRTGRRVVLKEARPYAGLAADGADAVTRLHREREALERLSGLACTPEVLGGFTVGDHHFLALEFVDGKPLNTFFARRHPLMEAAPSAERLAEYTEWALRIHRLVERAVAAVHERGIVFNDLHLFNIMVSEDESSVTLLDFEAARPAAEGGRQTVANPAFVAPADRRGVDVDRYALACLRIALFIPLTSLLAVDRGKAAHLAETAAARFPLPPGFLDEAVREITRDPAGGRPGGSSRAPDRAEGRSRFLPAEPGDWPNSRDSMVAAILASATPEREDRFFPGDIAQFATAGGGMTVGHGTAGVLHALHESGAPRCPEAEDRLLQHAKQPDSGTPLGFYDGLAGVAWTLERLGHPAAALELASLVAEQDHEALAPDLYGGTAGVGLALDALAVATGESGLHTAALRCAELSARPLRAPARPAGAAGKARTGLLHGSAGRALLFIRLYERTGDTALLDLAAEALHDDLSRCVRGASGTLQVDEGWRTMPYLGAGSVGIGMVIDDYLLHRRDDDLDRARQEIVRAAQATFYAQPGLFRGVAGMVLHLARTNVGGPGTTPEDVRRQVGCLSWHAMAYQGRLAFPGEQMMRLSMDLSTGTAGVLLALASALGDRPAHLPFLPPLPRPHEPAP
ncbi:MULTISPECIES: class III lanthionine synthetase LanKC [Streptomyces]|uniref:non-specific serine/threonine protein kinase n=1 Tax=Streptomyces venezuelae (strain ATCC 10712 / CBS 650.69 / DSM 40230 / JCM 4526 / NBRC 13096 / PD 04745) TaxID=953739 RepID=F2RG48_STRVP|nr:class III lanthionine synthetase LanKC [Streptomyces venezuelae]APE25199.1 serine/threonine protein kinase [Streptomyces venezuelae]QES02537.1 lantipeptide synthetase [Streptomyces venezuelae ATCC 10712]CCA59768.1 membrane translocator [Streptomyces venezuelae ATCC 10712]